MAYETTTVLGTALVTLLVGAGGTAAYFRKVRGLNKELRLLEGESISNSDSDRAGYGVDLPQPNVGRSPIDVVKLWWHLRKEAKMAKSGYIKWYRVGSRLHSPTWVMPERKGAGEMEYYHKGDDETYLFPEESLVTDGVTSAYVAIHKIGEAEPIDIRNPGWATMDADRLQTLVDMVISRDPPGGFSNLPLSSAQLKYGGMALLFVGIYAVMQMGVFG